MEKVNDWKGAGDWHPAGEKADYIQSPQTAAVDGKLTAPDVSGTGEGEHTPFCAQQGEHP